MRRFTKPSLSNNTDSIQSNLDHLRERYTSGRRELKVANKHLWSKQTKHPYKLTQLFLSCFRLCFVFLFVFFSLFISKAKMFICNSKFSYPWGISHRAKQDYTIGSEPWKDYYCRSTCAILKAAPYQNTLSRTLEEKTGTLVFDIHRNDLPLEI